jgi:hypothetical protein
MVNLIAHRRNSIESLLSTPTNFGVEIDLRWNREDGIYLAHDPGSEGVTFENWLKQFNHQTLILNVKEDGLESEISKMLSDLDIYNYFFLDQPFPTLLKSLAENIPCAVRISEFELLPSKLPQSPNWIWVDSFTGDWSHLRLHLENLDYSNSSICLVSPELQGRQNEDEITMIKSIIAPYKDFKKISVCTKFPELWNSNE